jgi:hypothetical protein
MTSLASFLGDRYRRFLSQKPQLMTRRPSFLPTHATWGLVGALVVGANAFAAPNRVLELDGFGSYVELPPNIFTNLSEATVEVWAKWDSFRMFSRVLEFGAAWQSLSLFNHERNPDLRFNLYPLSAKQDRSLIYSIRVNNLLAPNEWIHLAAVSGPGGMKLYANGRLVGQHTNAASFADIKVSQTNVFGTGLTKNPSDQDFRGQIDEVRVWNHRRTEAQIRENMTKRLTGKEEGLVGLWNFDDGTANDSSPNAFPGKLVGNAKVVIAGAEADSRLTASESQLQPQPQPVSKASPAAPAPQLPSAEPAGSSWNTAVWWIAGSLTLIVALLVWLVFMLRRSGIGKTQNLLPAPLEGSLIKSGSQPGSEPGVDQALKQRALAELTEFAKESLVQGLYSQQKALLETQQNAYRQLAELESRLAALRLPDRIQGYEKRIGELEKELETRNGEVRELTAATLLLLRRKLEEEKQLERTKNGFAT